MSDSGKKRDKGFITLLILIIVCACLMIAAVTTLGVGMSNGFGGGEVVGPGGPQGEQGAAGSLWYAGTGAPDDGIGVKGDFYLQDNGDVYQKGDSGWTKTGVNIKGATGAADIPYIGENGNWYNANGDTGHSAMGSAGLTPHIDPVTKHWFIGDQDTGVLAEGVEGPAPEIKIENGRWVVNGKEIGDAVGKDGDTPYIGDDGNWHIGDKTYGPAQGDPGHTPEIKIEDGYWYVDGVKLGKAEVNVEIKKNEDGEFTWWIDGADTGIVAQGAKGEKGDDGLTPHIDPVNKHWWIGTTDTGYSAVGEKGDAGVTPHIGENGNWYLGDVDTGKPSAGAAGAVWHSDEGVPVLEAPGDNAHVKVTGNVGDFYLDTLSGDVYRLTDNGWQFLVTLKATIENKHGEWYVNDKPTGVYSSTWRSGSGNPNDNKVNGYYGDLYLDLTNQDVYKSTTPAGEDATTGWELKFNMKGDRGAKWYSGTVDTTDPTFTSIVEGSQVGDMYLDTTTGNIYQCQPDGGNGTTWNQLFCIKGVQGERGSKWFVGSGEPSAKDPAEFEGLLAGDLYFDTHSGYIYSYDGENWTQTSEDAISGTRWYHGSVDPDKEGFAAIVDGAHVGDVYFNVETRYLYQLTEQAEGDPKWEALGKLNSGDRGTKTYYGTLDPELADEHNENYDKAEADAFNKLTSDRLNGDFYLQTYSQSGLSGHAGYRLWVYEGASEVGGEWEGGRWKLLLDGRTNVTPTDYTIYNYDDLRAFRDAVNNGDVNFTGHPVQVYDKLTGDIDVPEGFTGVGTEGHPFNGEIYGKKLAESRYGIHLKGQTTLFGYLGESARVHDLLIKATVSNVDLRTFKTQGEENFVSLLKDTFGIALDVKSGAEIKDVRLVITDSSNTVTVTVEWDHTGEVSVSVKGEKKASAAANGVVSLAAYESDEYAFTIENRLLELGKASFKFEGVKFTGTTYLDVTNAKSLELVDCYAEVDPVQACERDELGDPKYSTEGAGTQGREAVDRTTRASFIVSRSSSKTRGYDFELTVTGTTILSAQSQTGSDSGVSTRSVVDNYSTAIFVWAPVTKVTLEKNIFGAETATDRYAFTAVKFMGIQSKATLNFKDNTVYGTTEYWGFQAFDLCSAEEYTAVFEANTVNIDTTKHVDGHTDALLAWIETGSKATGGHAQVYFVGNGNTVQCTGDAEPQAVTAATASKYVGFESNDTSTDPANDFDFIVFESSSVLTEAGGALTVGKLTGGKVYLGVPLGSDDGNVTRSVFVEEHVDPDHVDDVWFIDITAENPLGFVQHAADYVDTYYVYNVQGLEHFRDMVNGAGKFEGKAHSFASEKVVVANNISLGELNWTPIGTDSNPFRGTFTTKFDNWYAIQNLNIDSSAEGYTYPEANKTRLGLFGYTDGATLTYIKISGVTIVAENGQKDNDTVGALVGLAYSGNTINNITVDGLISITGDFSRTGGVIGQTYGNFSDIIVNADAGSVVKSTGKGQSYYIGGILGHGADTGNYTKLEVQNLKVYGGGNVGGITGILYSGSTVDTATLTDVNILHFDFESGNNTSGSAMQVGAVSGSVTAGEIKIKNVQFTGKLERGGSKNANFVTRAVYNDGYSGGVHDGTQNPGTVTYTENNHIYAMVDTDLYIHDGNYEVKSAHGLQRLATLVTKGTNYYRDSMEGRTVTLMADIDLSDLKDEDGNWLKEQAPEGWTGYWNGYSYTFTSIGSETNPFEGEFDGNGKKITGLTNSLFASTVGTEDAKVSIHDLTLDDVAIDLETANVGALAGTAEYTSVKNVTVNGNVEGLYNVGGLIGSATNSTIADVNVNADVTLTTVDANEKAYARSIGGLVGAANGLTVGGVNVSGSLNNQYKTGNLNYLVYNFGLVGSALSGENANDEWSKGTVLPAANVTVDSTLSHGTLTENDKPFTAVVNVYVQATDLRLSATFANGETSSSVVSQEPNGTRVLVLVNSAHGLLSVSELVNNGVSFEGARVQLGSDISMMDYEATENTWTPIGTANHPFKGIFSGSLSDEPNSRKYKIDHLYGNLFGYTNGATIKDVYLGDAFFNGTYILVENAADTTIDGVNVNANVQGVNGNGVIKANDLASAPFGLYETASGTTKVVSTEIHVVLVEGITFTATIDKDSNAEVEYNGDTFTDGETAATHEYKVTVDNEIFRLGGFNDSVNATTPTASFTFTGIKFTGNSFIQLCTSQGSHEGPNVTSFKMTNCYADVKPESANGPKKQRQAAFIVGYERWNAHLSTKIEVTNNYILSENSATEKYSDAGLAIFSWTPWADGSVISGNTFGTKDRPYHNTVIKSLDFQSNLDHPAKITIDGNHFFMDGAHFTEVHVAVDLAPSQNVAYEAWLNNNDLHLVTEDANVVPEIGLVAAESIMGTGSTNHYQSRVFVTNKNSVSVKVKGVEEETSVKIDYGYVSKYLTNNSYDFVGYDVELDGEGKVTSGNFIFGHAASEDAEMAAALKGYVAAGSEANVHIVIGDDFGRRLSDLVAEKYDTYYIFSAAGYASFVSLVDSETSNDFFTGKTVAFGEEMVEDKQAEEKTIALEKLPKDSDGKFRMIGTKDHPFKGIFDGDGYTLSGLHIDLGSNEVTGVGLFAYASGAEIKDLTLENPSLKGKATSAGALVGVGENVTITNVTVTGLELNSDLQAVGGVVGTLRGTSVLENVSTSGQVQASYQVGGVVGQVATGEATLTDVISDASVTSSKVYDATTALQIGGFVGDVVSGAMLTVSGTANVTAATDEATSTFSGNLTRQAINNYTIVPTYKNFGLVGGEGRVSVSNTTYNVVIAKTGVITDFKQSAVWNETGEGTSEFDIMTVAGLKYFRNTVNEGNTYAGETVVLKTTVDLVATVDAEGRVHNWDPIGTKDHPFKGTFDGGYDAKAETPITVSGVSIVRTAEPGMADNLGFFGVADRGFVIRNLKLVNVYISATETDTQNNKFAGGEKLGAVVGSAAYGGLIENVTVSGVEIHGHHWVGGIVGYSYASVRNCVVENINLAAEPHEVTVVTAGQPLPRLDDGDKVGGLIGQFVNAGDMTVEGNVVNGSTEGSGAQGTVIGYRDLGGLIGCASVDGADDVTVKDNTVSNVNIVVDHSAVTSDRPYNGDSDDNADKIIGRLLGGTEDKITGNTDDNVTIDWSKANRGDFFKMGGVWHVLNKKGLEEFRDSVNNGTDPTGGDAAGKTGYNGETILLDGDINLDATDEELAPTALADVTTNWTPIGTETNPFKGTFDGQGHTISNLKINEPDKDYVGLFGKVGVTNTGNHGVICNLTVKDVAVSGHEYVGAVVGKIASQSSRLENITVENVTAEGESDIGGLVGSFYQGQGTDLTVKGNVSVKGNYKVGGLAGDFAYSTSATNFKVLAEEDSVVEGTPKMQDGVVVSQREGDSVGGVIGFTETNTATLTGLVAQNLTVKGTRVTGGIIGRLHQNKTLSDVTLTNVLVDNTGTPADYIKANYKKLFVGGVVGEALDNSAITVDGSKLTGVTVNVLYTYAFDSDMLHIEPEGSNVMSGQVLGGVREKNSNVTINVTGNLSGVTVNAELAGAVWSNDNELASVNVYTPEQFEYINLHLSELSPRTGTHDNWTVINIMNDLDMRKINNWVGTFMKWTKIDGHNHTVRNLNAKPNATAKAGLFGYAGDCYVKDLTLENVTAKGSQVGLFAGQAENLRLENCKVTGKNTVTYKHYTDGSGYNETYGGAGAIAGYTHNATFVEPKSVIAEGATVDIYFEDEFVSTGLTGMTYGYYLGVAGASTAVDQKYENLVVNGTVTVHIEGAAESSAKHYALVNGIYTIFDLDGLKYFRNDVNNGNTYLGKTVKLADSINLGGVETNQWTPIGLFALDNSPSRRMFRGTFDGDGKTISNLYYDGRDSGKGLFAYLGDGGVIENLTINNAHVIGQAYTGALLGTAEKTGRVENCHVIGKIEVASHNYEEFENTVGGLIGNGAYLRIIGCSVEATANSNSYVEGHGHVGGLVGVIREGIDSAIQNATVKNIEVRGKANQYGGPAGGNIGGVVGTINSRSSIAGVTLENVVVSTDDSAYAGKIGAIAGGMGNGTLTISGINATNVTLTTTDTASVVNYGLVGGKGGEEVVADGTWDVTLAEGFHATPDGYEIRNVQGLLAFATTVNGGKSYANEIVIVTDNIVLTADWVPMGTFSGTFKGKEGTETISGLKISAGDDAAEYKYGFFSKLDGATVENLTFVSPEIKAPKAVGVGVVAADVTKSVISNVTVQNATIVGGKYVGGIAGHAWTARLVGNTVSGALSVKYQKLGAIVGHIYGGNFNELESAVSENTVANVTLTACAKDVDNGYGTIGGLIGAGSKYNTEVRGNHFGENVTIVVEDGVDENWKNCTGAISGNPGAFTIEGNDGTVNIQISADVAPIEDGIVGDVTNKYYEIGKNDVTVVWNNVTITAVGVEISSEADLAWLRALVNDGNSFEGTTFLLTHNIELGGENKENWTPIGTKDNPFKGTFDGQGNTISGLSSVVSAGAAAADVDDYTVYGGLFGYVIGNGHTTDAVKNLTLRDVTVEGYAIAGAVAGVIENAAVENVTVTGNITIISEKVGEVENVSAAGGIAGILHTVSMKNCNVVHTEAAAANVSRLAVRLDAPTEDANTGHLIKALQYAGGIAAKLDFTQIEGVEEHVAVVYEDLHVKSMTIEIASDAGKVVPEDATKAAGGLVGTSNATKATVESLTVEDSDAKQVDIVYPEEASDVATGGIIAEETAPEDSKVDKTESGVATEDVKVNDTLIKNGVCLDLVEGASEGFYTANTYKEGLKSTNDEELNLWYEITTLDGLKYFRDSVNGGNAYTGVEVRLGDDIDLATEANWTPIGTSTNPFSGIFDGKNHEIKNLKITSNSGNYVGLFGNVVKPSNESNTTLKGLVLNGVSINVRTSNDVGALAGRVSSSGDRAPIAVCDITVKGVVSIQGKQYVGGLLGEAFVADIQNIILDCDDTSKVTGGSNQCGGVSGRAGQVTVKNVSSNLDVTAGTTCVGGLFGIIEYSSTIEDVNINATLTAGYLTESHIGGLIGGGQVGTFVFDNVHFTGMVTPFGTATVYQGYFGLLGKFYDNSPITITNSSLTFEYDGFKKNVEWTASGETSKFADVYTSAGLKSFRQTVNKLFEDYQGWTVSLQGNIDVSEVETNWTPIGGGNITKGVVKNPFKGTFDGNGFEISNMTIDRQGKTYTGLFGYVSGATLKDLVLRNPSVTSDSSDTGALVGCANDSTAVTGITVINPTVTGTDSVGGIAGNYFPAAPIQDVHVKGLIHITGDYKVGGIIGGGYGTVTTAYVEGTTGSFIKGVPAMKNGQIVSQHEGDNVGGIIGYTGEGGYVYDDLHVSGVTISGTRKVGGIMGSLLKDVTVSNVTIDNVVVTNTLNTPDDYRDANSDKLFVGTIAGEFFNNSVITGAKLSNINVNTIYTYSSGAVSGYAESTVVGGTRTAGTKVTITDVTCEKVKVNGLVTLGGHRYGAYDAEDLIAFAAAIRSNVVTSGEGIAAHLVLLDDIDMSGKDWTSLNVAHFVVEGGNYTISNLTATADGDGKAAFIAGFGVTVQNLTIDGFTAEGEQVAVFVANSQGAYTLTNCTVKGTVSLKYKDVPDYDEEYTAVGIFAGITQGCNLNSDKQKVAIDPAAQITVDITGMTTICYGATTDYLFGYYAGAGDFTTADLAGALAANRVTYDPSQITVIGANA